MSIMRSDGERRSFYMIDFSLFSLFVFFLFFFCFFYLFELTHIHFISIQFVNDSHTNWQQVNDRLWEALEKLKQLQRLLHTVMGLRGYVP